PTRLLPCPPCPASRGIRHGQVLSTPPPEIPIRLLLLLLVSLSALSLLLASAFVLGRLAKIGWRRKGGPRPSGLHHDDYYDDDYDGYDDDGYDDYDDDYDDDGGRGGGGCGGGADRPGDAKEDLLQHHNNNNRRRRHRRQLGPHHGDRQRRRDNNNHRRQRPPRGGTTAEAAEAEGAEEETGNRRPRPCLLLDAADEPEVGKTPVSNHLEEVCARLGLLKKSGSRSRDVEDEEEARPTSPRPDDRRPGRLNLTERVRSISQYLEEAAASSSARPAHADDAPPRSPRSEVVAAARPPNVLEKMRSRSQHLEEATGRLSRLEEGRARSPQFDEARSRPRVPERAGSRSPRLEEAAPSRPGPGEAAPSRPGLAGRFRSPSPRVDGVGSGAALPAGGRRRSPNVEEEEEAAAGGTGRLVEDRARSPRGEEARSGPKFAGDGPGGLRVGSGGGRREEEGGGGGGEEEARARAPGQEPLQVPAR
ncbi:uncharacterized protein LOC144953862, partial [Lampetra fluviatilis]